MKKVMKAVLVVVALVAAGSVIAGIVDRKEQKKAEEQVLVNGRKIHKPYGPYEKYFKRPLDFGLSLLAFVVLSPVMGVTAILVRIKLGSPVFFMQERPGRDEKVFTMLKFRSMSNKKDSYGNLLPDDKRLTDFGMQIRKRSLDELPELYNIIKGDMSIVGPRPLLVGYLPKYSERQRQRHVVRPGLTGLAQVSGRNNLSWEEKFKDDVQYVNKITFLSDLKIIVDTVKTVLRKDGISSCTSVTMEEFMGVGTVNEE